jgi:hypothetical protein
VSALVHMEVDLLNLADPVQTAALAPEDRPADLLTDPVLWIVREDDGVLLAGVDPVATAHVVAAWAELAR